MLLILLQKNVEKNIQHTDSALMNLKLDIQQFNDVLPFLLNNSHKVLQSNETITSKSTDLANFVSFKPNEFSKTKYSEIETIDKYNNVFLQLLDIIKKPSTSIGNLQSVDFEGSDQINL